MGTVLGGLLLPKFETFDYGRSMNQGILGASQQVQGQTALLALAEEKQKQAAQQAMFARIQNDPELRQRLFGDSILGSLPTTGGPPGAGPGPITQSPLGGGPAQQIPAYPDASRFANVPPQGGGPIPPNVMGQTMPTVTPPQGQPGGSVLASLGGQPQGPAGGMPGPQQAPQNALMEMARRDPRAALMLQQQIEQRQEQGLSNRIKVVDYLARMAQGATDQDSWKQFIEEAERVQPGSGGRLPQMYSKEARDRVVAQGLDAKETMTLQVADLKAQSEMRGQLFKEQQAAAGVPKYTEDSTLNVAIDRRMQQAGIPRGTPPPEAILTQAQQDVETAKVRVSASQGTGQIVQTPTGYVRINPRTNQPEQLQAPGGGPLLTKPTEAEQRAASFGERAKAAHDNAVALEEKGLTPSLWSKVGEALPFGLGNYLVGDDQQRYRQAVNQFAQALLRKESGAAISPTEYDMTEKTYFPQPGNSKTQIEEKRRERERLIKSMQEEGAGTGRTGSQGQPTSPGSAKPVGQMSKEDLLAEKQAILARGGR